MITPERRAHGVASIWDGHSVAGIPLAVDFGLDDVAHEWGAGSQ